MTNAWDVLINDAEQGPRPIMPNNPDLNSLVGIDNSNPLSQLQGSMFANSQQGRAMSMEMAKEKLANQMAIQLEQAKIDLAKANPEYTPHVTPYGGILMTQKYSSDVTEAYAGIPGAKEAAATGFAAQINENNYKASDQYTKDQAAKTEAEINKDKAMTDQATANAEYARGAKSALATARADTVGQGKPWGPEDDKKVEDFVNKKYGIPATDPYGLFDMMHPGQREKAANEIEQRIAAGKAGKGRGAQLTQAAASGIPAPAADGSQMPDVGSLMNLSNGVGKGLMDQ